MNYSAERSALLEQMQRMSDSELGQGTSGNISVRVEEGFLITPSAMKSEACQPVDMVLVDSSGQSRDLRKPSSEWRLHHDIYHHHADAQAVLHCHAPWCTTLACLNTGIPSFHYMVGIAGGSDIRCAPYATFGTQALSDHVVEALLQRRACLMANHGMICFADTLQGAFDLAEEVEALARIYCQTLQAGPPVLLDAKSMDEVLEKFSAYRSTNSN